MPYNVRFQYNRTPIRRQHQAEAKRCHHERRRRQAPQVVKQTREAIVFAGVSPLTESLWTYISPLLPPQKPAVGRPAVDHRLVIEGIVFVLQTGCSWRSLPERFGPWQTIVSRYQRWGQEGIWARILTILQTGETLLTSSP